MTLFQAVWLAVLQGVSELFPISSIGHTVLIPKLIGWDVDQQSTTFLPFLVTLHLGTALALLLFFWRDWLAIVVALLRSIARGKLSTNPDEHLGWMLVAGTIPTGLLGFFLEKPLRGLFAAPTLAAIFLIVNGFVMFLGEHLRKRAQRPEASGFSELNWRTAALIGVAQSAALIPGISRSGSTIVAGLLARLNHEDAARFSFLLATPVIAAAGLLEVPLLLHTNALGTALIGGVVAGITAWLSIKFLMRYFEFGRLDPFAYYCWAFGALSLAVLAIRG